MASWNMVNYHTNFHWLTYDESPCNEYIIFWWSIRTVKLIKNGIKKNDKIIWFFWKNVFSCLNYMINDWMVYHLSSV